MSCYQKRKSHQPHGLQYPWKVPLTPRQPFERDGTIKVFRKGMHVLLQGIKKHVDE